MRSRCHQKLGLRYDRRAGILAEYADAARVAGQACERAYEALSKSSGATLQSIKNGMD
ncbi:DUF2514 domain-containing protein [Cupriavidus gilardii]|uniref:DUF2514 domain-containing protein n=1 Tax=Cupriavidus gilardii TaxID=82541 RepID=UPI0021BECF36|nr:DUF2514 domain-containing protein [Cupriavidus gilardii]MCT9116314.1 DUF2514 domain-containing protein [Cupriavidus gilardii]